MKRWLHSDTWLKAVDATLGRALCGVIGWWDYLRSDGRSPGRPPAPVAATGNRMLIIRPGGMGDMILLLPMLTVLRREFPDAAIDILCENRNAGILEMAGFECEILRYDFQRRRLWQHLRHKQYTTVIDTEQFHNLSAVVGRLTRAPCRIGFKINPVRNLLYTHLINYALDAPEADQFMRLLGAFGLSTSRPAVDGMLAEAAESTPLPKSVRDIPELSGQPIENADRVQMNTIAVYAGASTPYKQWPIERYRQLIATLIDIPELHVILVGGREAMATSESLAQSFANQPEVGSRVISLAGRTSLTETAAILRRSRCFVGADCGLTHLAVAVGIPTVTLFGPSDPLKWGHITGPHAALHQGLSCSPCFIFGYHRLCRSRDCMAAISVEDVLAACRKALMIG